MFGALVSLPLRLRRCPPFGDPSSFVRGRGVYLLAYCVASAFWCLVCLAVGLFVPGDARVSRDPVESLVIQFHVGKKSHYLTRNNPRRTSALAQMLVLRFVSNKAVSCSYLLVF
jgi:hypothetical protein